MFYEVIVFNMMVGLGLLNPAICEPGTRDFNGHAAPGYYCEEPKPESEGGDASDEEIEEYREWIKQRDSRRPQWKAPMPARSRR